MYAVDKYHPKGERHFEKELAGKEDLILTRPEMLTLSEKEERRKILSAVHEHGWWLVCGCSENSNAVLTVRKTKNTVTVCRHGSELEHSVLCPARMWGQTEAPKIASTSKELMGQLMIYTDIGRLTSCDGEAERLSRQYSSLREFSRSNKPGIECSSIVTHPSALSDRGRWKAKISTTPVFAALVAEKVYRYRVQIANGPSIECPVENYGDPQDGARTWIAVVEFGRDGVAKCATVCPVISKADLLIVESSAEYNVVKRLRSLLKYWRNKSGKDVEARRVIRNGYPVWCLYVSHPPVSG